MSEPTITEFTGLTEFEDNGVAYTLEVDFVTKHWRDFKGYYGDQPAYDNESETEELEYRLNGEAKTLSELNVAYGERNISRLIEKAIENGIGL